MDRKKEVERQYLDEARRASSVFPSGEPEPHDPLDFLFPRATGALGIEITELCREDERHEGARLSYVAPRAQRLYVQRSGAKPVSVSPVFSRDADDMRVDVLASGLAEFVYRHRDDNANYSWDRCDLPVGYSHIGVFPQNEWEPAGKWRYFKSFSTARASKGLLEFRIAEKNLRLDEYRKVASEVWLLIVNDLFLGPGEVGVHAADLAQWSFDFTFEKVLLFERQPGGSGKVCELRRH